MGILNGLRPGRACLAGAPMFVAHRGGSRLAPENTMEAFRSAVEDWGVDMLETDAHLTRDGEVVLIHDATVDRTCDGAGPVRDMSLAEVQRLDAGYHFRDLDGRHSFRGEGVRVPSLAEVLEAFPRVRINVETKTREVAVPLVDLVRVHGAEQRVLVAAEYDRDRQPVRGYAGPWGTSRRQVMSFWVAVQTGTWRAYTPAGDVLQVPESWRGIRVVSPRFIRAAHARNIPVQVWTVDEEADMRRLLEWGVDGIQTDRPDVLARVLMDVAGRPAPPIWTSADP
ncbi:MAG: glycerophosphodiester phosphodiesterase [Gemmatimonadota bacterium]|nr:MAG: glycerophosphodiester phosphodiesterase [Gemmatimonadota bacterium]